MKYRFQAHDAGGDRWQVVAIPEEVSSKECGFYCNFKGRVYDHEAAVKGILAEIEKVYPGREVEFSEVEIYGIH